MIIIRNAVLPVEILWEYREFKRDEVPAPLIPFVHSYTAEQITEYVSRNGIEPIELSIIKNQALVTDGNHRIVAARNLGYDIIPVVITIFFGNGKEVFYDHTINRFKPITERLETELKKLFLRDDPATIPFWE